MRTLSFKVRHSTFGPKASANKQYTGCIIGKVTEKAMSHMEKDAEQKAKEKSNKGDANQNFALDKHKSVPLSKPITEP